MKKIFIFLFVSIAAIACNNDMSETVQICTQESNLHEVVLQKRNPNLPTIWSKPIKQHKSTRALITDPSDFLGNAYAIENGTSIIGDFANAKFKVVDLPRLLNEHPSYILGQELRTTNVSAISYADYSRLEVNSSITKNVKKGFSLNLGIFSFGRKKTTSETFIHNSDNTQNEVYGELSIEVLNGMFSLQTTPSALKRIAADYLDELFIDALYNSSMVELLHSYGDFVLTGYYTGGRASALYYGIYKENLDFESRETKMTDEIKASYSWKRPNTTTPNDSIATASAELTIGQDKGNSTKDTDKFSRLEYSVKTLGGAYGYSISTPAHDVTNFSVDLTAWFNSLNDPKTHTMIDIQNEGLYPISDFILEENFKQRYNDTHMGFQHQEELIEPSIEIMKMYVRKSKSGDKLYDVVPVLNTRQGDKLIFTNPITMQQSDEELKKNNELDVFMEKSRIIANQKAKYYGLAIKALPNKTINPVIQTTLSFQIENVDESNMFRFKNKNTNIWYIYNPSSLYCFAYYDDDYITDAYGIGEWIDSIPIKKVSMMTLYQRYKIYGL
ncbi:MAG: hypothetical protein LBN24_04605 [Mediterranea sp.]|jgi:hypothetical protein|nr:hypothetical protein [Mediterranea sp.]